MYTLQLYTITFTQTVNINNVVHFLLPQSPAHGLLSGGHGLVTGGLYFGMLTEAALAKRLHVPSAAAAAAAAAVADETIQHDERNELDDVSDQFASGADEKINDDSVRISWIIYNN